MADFDPVDLAFWQQCQARVTGYLTTNGMIEITLCGLYATTVAVLVSIAQSASGESAASERHLVFGFIIPLFSLVALSLSTRVYSWIETQLLYLALTGNHPVKLAQMVTYEEFKDLMSEQWRRHAPWRRALLLVWHSTVMFVSMPLNIANIYCYYFLLYTVVALVSGYYGLYNTSSWWYILVALLVFFYSFLMLGCRDAFRLKVVKADVRKLICPLDATSKMRDDTHGK